MNQRYVSGFLLSDDEIAKSQQLIDNFKTGTLAPGQVPDADLWKARREAYASAVAISCATSVGLGKAVERASFLAPTVRSVLSKTVPFVAVAAAGAGNAVFMRLSELTDGIDILDDEGVPRGRSQEAGKQSLTQVALTRVALPVPRIVTLCIWGAFPAAIALFPQYGSIPASQVEPQFQHLKNSKGQPITEFTYNKGI
ncbi:hypothetical protein DYB38_010975 [Aphanomyces astaci]|uniref:Sideroflexin n=1 Tax=Aphanomyces astaci TaxID=112090 RepID=A0A397D584_APHAT|nr:hypothetical protein DYB38_010975 [Aphanomyces astaci]RHY55927.1 hypothetical protein DYB34_001414 [Aphanomyces astaci]